MSVRFRPNELPEHYDTFTAFFRGSERPPNEHTLRLRASLVDDAGAIHADSTLRLRPGAYAHTTLSFDPSSTGVALDCALTFEHFAGGTDYGHIRMTYLLAYQTNPLVTLCNAARTDKGTERYSGRGVPHCYALEYHAQFAPFRDDEFSMLEIGLDDRSKTSGRPHDAPSLRVWREYFPRATLYGYDINDFSFLEMERTFTFQGDQSSRVDLDRFVAEHGEPTFRLIIDDGSHASSHQQASLAALFHQLEPGGLYVIEDLHWQPFPEEPSTVDVLTAFNESGRIDSPFIPDGDARYLEDALAAVEIHAPNDSPFAVLHKNAG